MLSLSWPHRWGLALIFLAMSLTSGSVLLTPIARGPATKPKIFLLTVSAGLHVMFAIIALLTFVGWLIYY